MTLLISKLEKLLFTQGLIIKNFFVIHSLCVYLEILNTQNGDIFLLYIPSKYEIKKLDKSNNTYKISYLDILDKDGNIINDINDLNDNELEKNYDEIELELSPDNGKYKNLKDRLEEKYNYPISLKDINKNDTQDIKDIFRQLRRLKFCVKNIKYKLGIIYKNYLCCIRRDNTFECYMIVEQINSSKNLLITLDLETLYSKLNNISNDIKTIKDGIYKVLNKNHLRHSKNLKNILEKHINILNDTDDIYLKKEKYSNYITNLEILLDNTETSRKIILNKIAKINQKYSDPSLKGLHIDIEKSHFISKQEEELNKIDNVKNDIIMNINTLKDKREQLYLNTDMILFDNSVMLDTIIQNINNLNFLKNL